MSRASLVWQNKLVDVAILLVLGFAIFPGTAELCAIQKKDVNARGNGNNVALPDVKVGRRRGAMETIVFHDKMLATFPKPFLGCFELEDSLLQRSNKDFKRKFRDLLFEVGLGNLGLTLV